MKIRARFVAVALTALSALAGCSEGEDEAGLAPPAVTEVVAPVEDDDAERPGNTLALPGGSGQKVVGVRRGKSVDLHSAPAGKLLERIGDETEFGSPTVFAVARTRGDWAAVRTPYFENGRLVWVKLDRRRLRADSVEWSVVVDLSDFQADLLLNGKHVRSFGVTVGAPESETPTGEFAVTDTFRGGLNPAYGCCAVALTARQLNLPSGWLGGDRIAIHGTTGPLGAELSNGCVRAANSDVDELVNRLPLGTPVTIRQ